MNSNIYKVVHHVLKDDGTFPNNASLPVLIYKQTVNLPESNDKAAAKLESLFQDNGWSNAWRNGIFNYHHYHSNTHEVLGIYNGEVKVMLGGPEGRTALLKKGDIIVIPAGVAHKRLEQTADFKCVGAYPEGIDYDMNYGKPEERPRTDKNIKQVKLPENDPLFGKEGPLFSYWVDQ